MYHTKYFLNHKFNSTLQHTWNVWDTLDFKLQLGQIRLWDWNLEIEFFRLNTFIIRILFQKILRRIYPTLTVPDPSLNKDSISLNKVFQKAYTDICARLHNQVSFMCKIVDFRREKWCDQTKLLTDWKPQKSIDQKARGDKQTI